MVVVAWALLGPLPARTVAAEEQQLKEYDVKAAFLYNFAFFVEWPEKTFSRPDSPFVIGVLGSDPFGTTLDEIIKDERVGSHPLILHRFNRIEEMTRCHILFIASSEERRLKDILRKIKNQPVLTVGDMPNFAESGGMIGFTAETRVGVVINPQPLRATGLTVSAKLMRLAHLVGDAEVDR